jgi:hypothetical protein
MLRTPNLWFKTPKKIWAGVSLEVFAAIEPYLLSIHH